MTQIVVQGFVIAPTQADIGAGIVGYDNADFFGVPYANLGGAAFSVTWTGVDCNCSVGPNPPYVAPPPVTPITDAALTINGVSLDLGQYNNIVRGDWFDLSNGPLLTLQTQYLVAPFPSGGEILPGSIYTLTTGPNNPQGVGGVVTLSDFTHDYQTSVFLHVTSLGGDPPSVPGPVLGQGLSGLILFAAVAAWWKSRWPKWWDDRSRLR